MEKKIINLIKDNGPLTGSEIWEVVGGDGLILWRTCKRSQYLTIRTAGTHYLRLDRRLKGFTRLSPSIFREFLTYSVVGLSGDVNSLEKRIGSVASHIEEISKSKVELAFRVISGLSSRLVTERPLNEDACFIIAGDIVYNMAHDVPRPERSTGKLVNGSDMDIVVIMNDECGEDLIKRLDNAIYQEKYRLLIAPHIREEIDYIVKDLARVREQLRFDSFRHILACKILQEGTLLYGSEDIFHSVKSMLRDKGVTAKLEGLERLARVFRRDAEQYLLREDPDKIIDESLYLFYPTEESEEFE
ncbi:MAG: hypothetical protein JRF53_11640 [Deltaproteobacteria bacterium]|nr:hypothetical protein [Deltaproteobacteria bacterium]MBW2344646.1 hypothetical protein [Deltaproteobacteria bacterium]